MASSSASRLPAPWPAIRRSSSPTSLRDGGRIGVELARILALEERREVTLEGAADDVVANVLSILAEVGDRGRRKEALRGEDLASLLGEERDLQRAVLIVLDLRHGGPARTDEPGLEGEVVIVTVEACRAVPLPTGPRDVGEQLPLDVPDALPALGPGGGMLDRSVHPDLLVREPARVVGDPRRACRKRATVLTDHVSGCVEASLAEHHAALVRPLKTRDPWSERLVERRRLGRPRAPREPVKLSRFVRVAAVGLAARVPRIPHARLLPARVERARPEAGLLDIPDGAGGNGVRAYRRGRHSQRYRARSASASIAPSSE